MFKILMVGLLASVAWSTDFSQMSTEDMMHMRGSVPLDERPAFREEMQKRMQSMSPEDRQKYMETKGMGMGKGMMSSGKYCMRSMPTFEQYDLNNDGKITESELDEARAKRMSQKAKEGKMLKKAAKAPAFSDMDKNKDGSLNREEFRIHQEEQLKKWDKKYCCPRTGQSMKRNGANTPSFADIDTNKDGVISQEEFRIHQMQRMQNRGNCPTGNCP